jgi:phosphotransferase system HPr (HPr) family protein
VAQKQLTVQHKVGLHARPAASFVQIASKYPCDITVTKVTEGKSVNAKSILGVLSLGVGQGDAILVEAAGNKADEAVSALSALVESNFGE